ncbi:BamA/TamA family outer membrane protein [Novosphingobium sp.]|uniref:BamA/TamA family outer membrane protein n=1 Tax=Novosphingobium sp. TaxID=1874826 RepID=UPI0031DA70E4
MSARGRRHALLLQGVLTGGLLLMMLACGAHPAWAQDMAPTGEPAKATPAANTPAQPATASAPHEEDKDDAELRSLIPDSARTKPEDWARQLPPATNTPPATPEPVAGAGEGMPQAQDGPPLSATSPLADLPGFSLDWPRPDLQLPPLESLSQESDAVAALAALDKQEEVTPPPVPVDRDARSLRRAEQAHYTLEWAVAIPERVALEARFHELSALAAPEPKPLKGQKADPKSPDQELPQIAVRATTDRALLERLLHVYGYYDGEVLQSIGSITPAEAAAGVTPMVAFDLIPGRRYRFGEISTGHLADAGPDAPALRDSLGIKTGDALHADAIPEGITSLQAALGEAGYPFAKIGAPELTVDHTREEGDLALEVTPEGKYRFGKVTSGSPHFLSAGHLQDIARFKPGQLWRRSEIEDFRRAVLATGLVSSVTVTPRVETAPQPDVPGIVATDVTMTPAPLHTIAGEIGYDTAEGFRLAASWEHRNLFPPEGLLRLRGIAGTHEQMAGVTFRRSNFLGRDRVLTVDVYGDNATLTAYAARKVAFAATYERQTTLLFQKPWVWSLGLQSEISDEREGVPSGITTGRTQYITTALPLRAAFDATDSLLDPQRGWRASLRVSPEIAFARGDRATYAVIQADASAYHKVSKGVELAGRIRLGSITAGDLNDVAPSRRFYAGGGASIRGYGYELVGPRNDLGEPKGGRGLYEVSLEARVDTPWFGGGFQLVPFIDGGGVDPQVLPGFRDMRYGAGMGVRYKTSFGPIRLDIGTPLNPRHGDGPVAIAVALGQAF